MTHSFRPHVPGFVDCEPGDPFEFNTTEELLTLPWVDKFARDPDFDYFAKGAGCLMAVYKPGSWRGWWVIGYIDSAATVDLPTITIGRNSVTQEWEVQR